MKTRTSRDEWALRVQRWKRSGLSAEAFARREEVSPGGLTWWRWKIGHDETPAPADDAAAFVRVEAPLVSSDLIEVALDNGRIVRVPAVFDEAVLARVLAVAESR